MRITRDTVPSGLKGKHVDVRIYKWQIKVWFASQSVERLPRLTGVQHHRINYRHVIDSLLRAKRDLLIEQEFRHLDCFDVLILDDIGYVQQSRDEMEVKSSSPCSPSFTNVAASSSLPTWFFPNGTRS